MAFPVAERALLNRDLTPEVVSDIWIVPILTAREGRQPAFYPSTLGKQFSKIKDNRNIDRSVQNSATDDKDEDTRLVNIDAAILQTLRNNRRGVLTINYGENVSNAFVRSGLRVT